MKKICATFPKVKECVFLSTRTRDNVDALKGLIVREATKLPHVGAKNPKAYKVLEQKVMTTKKLYTPPVVSWEEFCRMGGQVFFYSLFPNCKIFFFFFLLSERKKEK